MRRKKSANPDRRDECGALAALWPTAYAQRSCRPPRCRAALTFSVFATLASRAPRPMDLATALATALAAASISCSPARASPPRRASRRGSTSTRQATSTAPAPTRCTEPQLPTSRARARAAHFPAGESALGPSASGIGAERAPPSRTHRAPPCCSWAQRPHLRRAQFVPRTSTPWRRAPALVAPLARVISRAAGLHAYARSRSEIMRILD